MTLPLRTRAVADLALRVDDPLPRDVIGAGCHRAAHPARTEGFVRLELDAVRRRQHEGNLFVGRHPSARDLADERSRPVHSRLVCWAGM
ncbi:MAG: hypothetical protein MZV64_17315 [Ignavibacteriales bacterium]|nr:hypothetical protein [Ignavibacteriales bacterium]